MKRLRSRTRLIPLLAGICLSLLPVSGWIGYIPKVDRGELVSLVLGPNGPECTAECSEITCPLPTGDSHEWVNVAGSGWIPGPNSHPCLTYEKSCAEDGHKRCEPEDEEDDLEAVLAHLPFSPGPDIRDFLDRNPTRVHWNPERRSIQVVGCAGRILASLLVTEAQAGSLSGKG